MVVQKKAPKFKINRSAVHTRKRYYVPVQISQRFTRDKTIDASQFAENLTMDNLTANLNDLAQADIPQTLTDELDSLVNNDMGSNVGPLETVSIEWEEGGIEIDWTDDILEIEWEVDPSLDIYVEPHKVNIFVQYDNEANHLKIKTFHAPTGIKVDKKI